MNDKKPVKLYKKFTFYNLSLIFYLAFSPLCFGQGTDPGNAIYTPPTIIPASPTVAGFMKFEEVPVNNYTGIPDISIPLYSVGTRSKDITIDLSLRYHPSSIAVEESASFVGLGWSLFGGGTISRTVRGMTDEYELNGVKLKYGIHHTSNPYYDVVNLVGPNVQENQPELHEYIWETAELGKYDSEHDLYQFNFMGYSGRFIITRKPLEGYRVVKLDNNNTVAINYDSVSKTFILFDDKGYKYVFDIYEMSQASSTTAKISFKNTEVPGLGGEPGAPTSYISAFHLSKIYDKKDNLLVEFEFGPAGTVNENETTKTTITNRLWGDQNPIQTIQTLLESCPGTTTPPEFLLEPKEALITNSVSTLTRKITKIKVIGIGTIDFELASTLGTVDYPSRHRLKNIIVKNFRGELMKKIELFHDFSLIEFRPLDPNSNRKIRRLRLRKVSETYGNKTLSYELDYLGRKEGDNTNFSKDYWGYINAKPDYNPEGDFKETHWFFCKMDLLQKMKLPTGGSVVYEFEPNTYSYIGSTPVTDFSVNPFNWFSVTIPYPFGTTTTSSFLKYSIYDQKIFISQDPGSGNCYFKRRLNETFPWESVLDGVLGDAVLEGGYQYSITRVGFPNFPPSEDFPNPRPFGAINITYFTRKDPELKYLYGGGVRIKKIGYFEENVHPWYYECKVNPQYYENGEYDYGYKKPIKEKHYDYHFFNDSLRSSGSLVFAKPVFDYTQTKKFNLRCKMGNDGGLPTSFMDIVHSYQYKTTTDFNNLKAVKTHGADVGYKNVRITETNNGSSEYVYRSPIDKPEDSYAFSPPFLATSNKDDLRGQLLNESYFTESGDKILETINSYDDLEDRKKTGLNIWFISNCPIMDSQNYSGYISRLNDCPFNPNEVFCNECVKPINYISVVPIIEYFNWSRLKQKITKNYFYDSNHVQRAVTKVENFTYKYTNKKIETYTSNTSDSNETIKNEYTYYQGTNNHISDLSTITTSLNNITTGFQSIDWGESGNEIGQPLRIRKDKAHTDIVNAEIFQEFIKYNEYGNVVTMTDGPSETGLKTIIWGYNNTLPIAVIEGDGYDYLIGLQEVSVLITAAQELTDNYETNSMAEQNRLSALKALRVKLPDNMVTTYTHKPLVGITSVTDPRGYTTYYEYDEFNRLKAVKDAEGNLISENKYNYKN